MNDKTKLNDFDVSSETSIFKAQDSWLIFEAHATASSEKRPFRACTLICPIPFITDSIGVR
jgi:hypothetical protein